jgi:dsDNA-specific endonuclease/ATPase MutS2
MPGVYTAFKVYNREKRSIPLGSTFQDYSEPGILPEPRMTDDPFENEVVRIPVTDVFDLHTVPPRDVEGVVEEYLNEANRLGLKALRIIHGRGIGVQREIVRKVLARTPFVAAFADAPAQAGGWGATVVTLHP